MTDPAPLAGLRVLDASTLYAAPLIATLLADHGAEVVKIEAPGGDPYRHYPTRMWPLLARDKQSWVVDLRSDTGCAAVRDLVPELDVIVLNMPPGLLARRGLDWATLSELNPRLVMACLTGFGLDGPYADRPGNGTLAEGFAGLTHMTGPADGTPVLASVPLGDAITAYVGAFGVLSAIERRHRTGRGGVVDVNPLESLLHAVGPMLTEYAPPAPPPHRLGNRLGGSVIRNVFRTADDRYVSISTSTPRHSEDIAALTGHVGEVGDGALERRLRTWVADRLRDDVLDAFVAARLPIAPVQDAADVLADPHLTARGSIQKVTTGESGVVYGPAPAPRLDGVNYRRPRRTPGLDEHRDPFFPPRAAERS